MREYKRYHLKEGILSIADFGLLVLDYACVFVVAIATGCAWVYDAELQLSTNDLLSILLKLLVITVVLELALGKKVYCQKKNIKILTFTALAIITYSFVNPYNADGFKLSFMHILPWLVIWFLLHDDKEIIWNILINIILLLSAVSLVFYLFGSVFNLIPELYKVERIWGGWAPQYLRNFYYLYYESQMVTIGELSIWRNCSIYTEAPMYNVMLCIAMAAEMFLIKNPKRWKLIFIGVSIVTTFSTTGFIFLAVAVFFYFIINKDKYNLWNVIFKHIKIAVLLVVAMVVLIVRLKLLSVAGRGSMNVRTDHVYACLKAFLNFTLYGCGWQNKNAVLQFAEKKQGLSVGLPYYMACGGILLSSIIFIPIIHDFCTTIVVRRWNVIVFEFLFLLLFFFTAISGYPILLLFIAYILTKSISKDKEID